jgi:hypothetical protein
MFTPDGECIATGYSGDPVHKNDPNAQSLRNQGPIPEGDYTFGSPVKTFTHGPYVLPLYPDPKNLMWNRYGFLIHGDNITEPGTASQGCIILAREFREMMWNSSDHTLQVIAQKEQP